MDLVIDAFISVSDLVVTFFSGDEWKNITKWIRER